MQIAPSVNGLESDVAGQVDVVRLNVRYPGVEGFQMQDSGRGHPFFAVVDKDGQLTDVYFGPQKAEVLGAAMDAVRP